jgi:hypothetical protein
MSVAPQSSCKVTQIIYGFTYERFAETEEFNKHMADLATDAHQPSLAGVV